MATRKKKTDKEKFQEAILKDEYYDLDMVTDKKEIWPKVTVGSHSTRTEYEDGRIDFVTDWDALQRDVKEAIASVESKQTKNKKKK